MAAPSDVKCAEGSAEIDIFRDSFKYYKKRKPPPDLSAVVDFRSDKLKEVVPLELTPVPGALTVGLRPSETWKSYRHLGLPGLYFIVDPFLPGWQCHWAHRCMADFPNLPNKSNLDAHLTRVPQDNIWWESVQQRKTGDALNKTLMHKLRWVTLGYHHNWDTKEYSSDNCSPFPSDLAQLTGCIAAALNFPDFTAEAAIVNFYHLDSTLAGHTDHSELDHQAPLISISLGQTAVFLLGGPTKATKPVAMFLHSGDVVVMSGPARLAYHAIPKILSPNCAALPQCLQPLSAVATSESDCSTSKDHVMETESLENERNLVLSEKPISVRQGESNKEQECSTVGVSNNRVSEDVTHVPLDIPASFDSECVQEYLLCSRINLNVRQVLKPGQLPPLLDRQQKPPPTDFNSQILPPEKKMKNS